MKVNDKIPELILKDQNNQDIHVYEALKEDPVILYFYPKGNTLRFTREACGFRGVMSEFIGKNVRVMGISGDSPKSHQKFAAQYNLPFTLLSDQGNKIRKMFKVPKSYFGLIAGRVTYIIDEKKVIRGIINSHSNAMKHVVESLAIVNSL
jgi:peroxiredoxin Q/BCP